MFRGDPKRGPHLVRQQVRPAQELETKATHPQGRVRLGWLRQGWEWFVRSHVEGSQDDRPRPHRIRNRLQHRDLLILGGELVGAEKEELAAEQSDAVRAGGRGALGILEVGRVAADLDPASIPRDGGFGIDHQCGPSTQVRNRVRRWIDEHRALVAVEQQGLTIGDRVEQARDANHGRQAERAGEDRRMRRRRSLLGGKADDEGAVQAGRLRGGEVARHHDRGLQRQRRDVAQSMQGSTHLLDHVVDISRARLKDGVR